MTKSYNKKTVEILNSLSPILDKINETDHRHRVLFLKTSLSSTLRIRSDGCPREDNRTSLWRLFTRFNSTTEWKNRHQSVIHPWVLERVFGGGMLFPLNQFFFFRMLAQSYTPNIYTLTPILLLYKPFTIVLHKRLCAYLFRAAHTPAC